MDGCEHRRARDTLERALKSSAGSRWSIKQELIGQSEQRWRDAAIEGCYRSINLRSDLRRHRSPIRSQRVVAFAINAFMNKAAACSSLRAAGASDMSAAKVLLAQRILCPVDCSAHSRGTFARWNAAVEYAAASAVHDLFLRSPSVGSRRVRSDVTDR